MSPATPPAGRTAAVTPVVVLRAFLGFVYLYAGISKIADRRFLTASDPTSIHSTVLAARSASPIGSLLGPVVQHSTAFGVLIAAGELAVGVGMAAGLFTRVAAAGGALLALGLWLTVSWHAQPWYTSADVVYLAAFTPFLLGARPGPWSVDGWLDRAAERSVRPGDAEARRALVSGLAVLGGAAVLGVAALFRRTPHAATKAGPAGPVRLLPAAKVPVGGAGQAQAGGKNYYVVQPAAGHFTALDAACPHQGCTVEFVSAAQGFVCPCHQSRFSYSGALASGPATRGLSAVPATVTGGEVVIGG